MSELPELSGAAGAAFLLSEPARLSTNFEHPEGITVVREGAANVTVNLTSSHDVRDIKAHAWRIAQESFDVLAAQRRATLATSMGEKQCLFWLRQGGAYDLTCVLTTELRWSIEGSGTAGVPTPTIQKQTFTHHKALRYYRMSQCARSLFNAYRNAYLALECIVSDESAKAQRESELEWLKRVISGSLAAAVPSGLDIMPLLEAIYRSGRNPLFHAKIGETFYPPHGAEREKVQELFEKLTILVASLLQHKLGRESVKRWATMSQAAQDAQSQAQFDFDEVCFKQESNDISVASTVEVIESPRRFGRLWARVTIPRPEDVHYMKKVQFLRQGKLWIGLELDERVPMSNVGNVNFEINTVIRNAREPTLFYTE